MYRSKTITLSYFKNTSNGFARVHSKIFLLQKTKASLIVNIHIKHSGIKEYWPP